MHLQPMRFLDPKSDVVFKKIFGQHPHLIKSFLNHVLPLPPGALIEHVEYITPEQTPRIPGMKNTIVDVKCTDEKGRIFIVEMQVTWSKTFWQRFLFGTSKAYVQQLGAGKSYDELCPVYGLALVNQVFDENTDEWYHHYRLTHTKDLDKTLEGLEVVFVELPKFNPQTWRDRKIGVLWMRFLREIGTETESIPEDFKESPEVLEAVELAQESAYSKAELEVYDYHLDAIRVEKIVRHDAYEEGREEEKKAMARKMLEGGLEYEAIENFTGLNVSEIKALEGSH